MESKQITIGVMGSSRGNISKSNITIAKELGKIIAQKGFSLLTGGCSGLPYEALKSCYENGGDTIIISAARNAEDHINNYKSPLNYAKHIIYTGFGDLGRTIINIRSSDALVFIQGGVGTLTEFAQAIGEKKIIGILENTGGISEEFKQLLKRLDITNEVIFSYSPDELMRRIIKCLEN